jgi:hypothetical protein
MDNELDGIFEPAVVHGHEGKLCAGLTGGIVMNKA